LSQDSNSSSIVSSCPYNWSEEAGCQIATAISPDAKRLRLTLDNRRFAPDNPRVARVVLEQAGRIFVSPEGRVAALDGVSLAVESGELLLLSGPSGSGKTTLLRVIAGLETLSEGQLYFDGKDMVEVPPHMRNVAMVFQNPALYPHMTARQNMEFGLRLRGIPARERSRRVDEAAELLGIRDLLNRRPSQISGGQCQRVALGRAWVRRPDVFLLDEPFTSLETSLRAELRQHVRALQSTVRATTILVSHDPEDLLEFGGRIALLQQGKLAQVGNVRELREAPG
jgi:multiple sugar transport system ATP-binding protein